MTALFRITAVFTTPSGERAQLTETVMSPVAPVGDEANRMTAAHCGTDWATAYPDPAWMIVQVTTSLSSGSTWPSPADDIVAQVEGLNSYAASSGAIRPSQAPCASGLIGVPATGSYLLPVDRTARPDSAFSWGHGTYGFAWDAEGQDVSTAPFSVTSCTLERSDAASASAAVSSWDPAHPDPGSGQTTVGCSWGTV